MTADRGYLARALCESSPMTDSHESPNTSASPSTPPLSLTVLTSVALFVAAAGLVAMGISTRR